MTTATPFDFRDYIQQGVRSNLFAGGGIGFSANQAITCVYSDSPIPDSPTPFSKKTLFDIASITKSIVGLVILKLVEQGRLKLEDLVIWFVDGVGKDWEKITIQHLLTNSVELDFTDKLYTLEPEDIYRIITSANVKMTENVLHLGNYYYYHNSNSILLGWVLEKILGKPLAQIIQEEVFNPAGMTNTFFSLDIPEDMKSHVHPSFNRRIGDKVLVGIPHDEITYRYTNRGQNVGCAGIFATVEDMLKFGNYVLYGAFNDSETMLAKMATNYLKEYGRTSGLGFDNPKRDYVCPCFADQTLVSTGHTGCAIWIHTRHQKVLTILTNGTYPVQEKPRESGEIGLVSPLFDYRQKLVRSLFHCKACDE